MDIKLMLDLCFRLQSLMILLLTLINDTNGCNTYARFMLRVLS